MAYSYPQIAASQPEATNPVPGMTYEFWIVSGIAHNIENVISDGGDVRPVGSIQVKGQKLNYTDGVISPLGDPTEFVAEDIWEALNAYPEFAAGYNNFVQVCAQTLELIEATKTLQARLAASFEDGLARLRSAYQHLDNDTEAAKVTECITNYPAAWDIRECLEYLGLWLRQFESE